MEAFRGNRRRGAALLLSLWALFLLSAMVISWALEIGSRLALSGKASRGLEAEAMACSGAEVAMHPNIKPDSEVLRGRFGKGQRYEAHLTGEGGRLNLNWVTQMPENPRRVEVLRRFLEIKGFELDERDRMIDTLLDWVDADNLVRLNGDEGGDNYQPANRPLRRLEELKKVRGWEEFTSSNDWDADLTLDSQGGGQGGQPGQPGQPAGINLAWASRDLILTLPGVSEDRVDQFLAMRSGPDGIDGTEDDAAAQIQDITQAEVALGSPQGQFSAIGVTFNRRDSVWRVVSVGKSGEVTRTVRVVFVSGNPPQLKSWKEF